MVVAIFLSLLLYALCTTAEAQQLQSNIISLGSSLTPTTNNSSWLSRSGLYAFGFYQQGNGFAVGVFLAGIPEQTVVWTAYRDDPPVPGNATLMLTSDGRLILKSTQGQDINIADFAQRASSASMLDSGNFVIYNSSQRIIWESFDHPTDTLLPGQRLLATQQLFSSSSETHDRSTGIFRLNMQADGNLVQYPVNTPDVAQYAYWASHTDGVGVNVTLNLDDNGRLYLLNSNTSLKNLTEASSTKGKFYLLKLDVDGILRLYFRDLDQRGNFSAIWSSSSNRCDPKGLCGLNGYCILLDDIPDCRCLPGFDSVNPGNWSSGCERNFTAEGCKDDDGRVIYAMSELDNTWWEDVSYLSLSLSKEDCEKACLEDCNCEAALFRDGECRKQRLPLRYGRRLLSDSTIALIKVATSSTPTIKDDLPKERKKELRVDILIVSVSFLVIAFLVLLISGVLIYRNRGYAYRKISETRNVELYEDIAPRAFTYAELEQVTDGFKEEVGKGSFGTVYKGIIMKNQKVVAVKRLDKVLAEGEREFQTEMKVIGKTHHRNLVRLVGYCLDGPKRLLVYDFMANGSLADLLFSTTLEKRPYNWDERISIALDIARGILYLHEECETQIIHCDIKPQNILMDEYRCAKIADFGLAKLLKPDQTNTFTGIRGTRGYVAPEWHRKLPVTIKADVYSYGIVLFEIICCRRSLDWSLFEDEAILEQWVYECFQLGEVGKLVGDEEVDQKKLERMVRVGLWCIQDEPSLRPSMKKVLLMLEGTVDIPIPPSPTSFLSTM